MDPYVYPGTNVLRNLRDIRDPEELSKFEGIATTRRIAELARNPIPGKFDAQHVQSIHGYIFQDVYAWAGEFRTVNISRSGQFPFAFSHHILHSLSKLGDDLAKERHLANLARSKFASRAAHYLGELNAIHPFRDGNGRTQREFIRALAGRNGYALDWSRISREQMSEASKSSFQQGNNSGLEKILHSALENERIRAKDERAAASRQRGEKENDLER
jgi:cell filamentation protein